MHYEYMTVKVETSGTMTVKIDENELNEYLSDAGNQGWELVDSPTFQVNGWTKFCVLIFKRPK